LAYVLWLVVILKCVTPPVWSSPTGAFSWARVDISQPTPALTADAIAPSPLRDLPVPVHDPLPVADSAGSMKPIQLESAPPIAADVRIDMSKSMATPQAKPEERASQLDLCSVLTIVWLCGAFALAGALVIRRIVYTVVLWRACIPADEMAISLVAELSRRLGIRRRVRVLVTAKPFGPAVCGLWRPKLLLPQNLVSACRAGDLERIIAHELIHVRRGDEVVGTLQLVAQVLWWFHPLVWWANREMCREREHCCDEEAIASLDCDPHSYAQTLLDTLKLKRRMRPLLAFAAARAGEVTSRRLERIMDDRRTFHHRMPRACWGVLIAGLAFVLPGAGLSVDAASSAPIEDQPATSAQAPPFQQPSVASKPSSENSATGGGSSVSKPDKIGRAAPRDMAIIDDTDLGLIKFSPDGRSICVSADDFTATRLYVAPYPPTRLEDYRRIVELRNTWYGVRAIGWCHTEPERLAFIVEQTTSRELPRLTLETSVFLDLKRVVAEANLTREDFDLILYTVNADGTGLRQIFQLEDLSIQERNSLQETALAWPSAGELHYCLNGRIMRVDPASGRREVLYEKPEGKRVRGLYLDRQKRVTVYEVWRDRGDSSMLVTLDKKGNIVRRNELSDLVRGGPWLLYAGGSLYLESFQSLEIHIMSLDEVDPLSTLSDEHGDWSLSPYALTPDERELVCRATRNVVSKDGKGLPGKGEAIVELHAAARSKKLREMSFADQPDIEHTYRVEKLVRVPIRPDPRVDRPHVVAVWPADDAVDVDPITEIRVRFDRPMEPSVAELAWESSREACFRPRGVLRYLPETNEFVLPVALTPGAEHQVSSKGWLMSEPLIARKFRSADGIPARRFSWRFRTRDVPVGDDTDRPQIVSIEPEPGSEAGIFTTVRVRFDRAMMPDRYELVDVTEPTSPNSTVSVPFSVEYDTQTHSFAIPVLFTPNGKPRIELRDFSSEQGAAIEPVTIEYVTSDQLHLPKQAARIDEAGRSVELRELVGKIHRSRRSLKSLEETIRITSLSVGQPTSFDDISMLHTRFAFQGQRQFYAEASEIMRSVELRNYQVGSDGRECWNLLDDQLTTCPYESFHVKNVLVCDPFGSQRFETAQEAIQTLRLEYLGSVEYQGATCHRIRSWRADVSASISWVGGLQEWFIDAESLLPVIRDEYGTYYHHRHEYIYHRVNEPIPEAVFQAPAADGIERREPEPLGEGYDRRFLNARDGSDGRMSVRWGRLAPGGTRNTHGLGSN